MYSNVREDSSIGSTFKLPAEVELHKRSIIDTLLSQNNILISH
ncbi:MAG: palindromic element RPE1 domain-containing protein [Candidatus Tisiphia sp.]